MGDGSPCDWAARCLCGHRVDSHNFANDRRPCKLCTCPGLHGVRSGENTSRDCPSCKENGAEYERCKRQAQEQSDAKNAAYHERNQLVAALARLYPSGWRKTDIPGWDPEWHGCVFIDLPTGQVSWHYHDREAALFELLPEYTKPWDGHTTEEKYTRLANLGGGYTLRRTGLDPLSAAVMADVTRTGSVRAGHPRFYELLDLVAAMHAKKNSDYAKQADSMSNFRMCEAFGVEAWRGAMVRMSDKWARLTVLATKDRPSVSDETFEDTLMDLAAYALLVRILREEAAAGRQAAGGPEVTYP